ncbi:hypothetical protein BLJAPNOD_05000 [Ensifer sp. M14]|uniref:hypothetical protein n=1 Tax=Ensifer sp. M14 TaxID=2203782 RepID=UPI000E2D59D7|nr:hypothetical protein [Ensifer sp. M14]RDL48722.1 hypothetical protein BLJAPNOD_05000 [Ensifer sp. M14]
MAYKANSTNSHRSFGGGARSFRLLPAFLASTSLIVNPVFAGDLLPTGGSVASGSVSIGTSGTTMTVTQGSDKAIVNWNGFSIGQGHAVNFVQPEHRQRSSIA